MKIRDYLQSEIFAHRAAKHGIVVVYDPVRRYREVLLSLSSPQCRVLDAGSSIIEAREAASRALRELTDGKTQQLILWLPTRKPESDEDRQTDPFSVFGRIGAEFPAGDADDYAALCRVAKPDHVVEINKLFEQGEPSFDTVDALDQGGAWPKLKTLLAVDSPREILVGLLAPKHAQEEALKADPTWLSEAREFVERNLGHKLKTRGQTRQSLADELWRLLLFSEFVFDSSGDLPPSLAAVPCALSAAQTLVFDTCEELRKHQDHKETYLAKAQQIEDDLVLPERSKSIAWLGTRDTFAFEERYFLRKCVNALLAGKLPEARQILTSRQGSVWLSNEERLAEWTVAERALDLLESAENAPPTSLPNLETLIAAYASSFRDLDRRHRELEQAVADRHEDDDILDQLIATARTRYLKVAGTLQAEFVRLVHQDGWPVSGGKILRNTQVFDRQVAPLLESGHRVAYLLIDSLRYELAVELEKQLSEKHGLRLHTVCAQLPTYTEVGMASLMPEADHSLFLSKQGEKLVTTLGGAVATTPTTRLAFLQSKKGDLCADVELDQLVQPGKKLKIPDKVKLLVVRSRDLDSIAHESPHQVLQVIPKLVRQIIKGINKLETLGFQKAIIATDHGFILVQEQEAGNVVPKPSGEWLIQKSRCLLGQGSGDGSNLLFPRAHVGIPGDFEHYATPKHLVPYSRGQLYYHDGLSLQECVLPCLSVDLKAPTQKKTLPALHLTYRQGKMDKITSRRPVLDLAWSQVDAFADEQEIEVTIEAMDSKGNIVGLVGSGQTINPATQGVRIRPGLIVNVGLRMEDDFSGLFTVRVLDPATQAVITDLHLKTAYLE